MNMAYAQLGEVAGPLNFNVNTSGSQTMQLTVINSGSTPIGFKVLQPSLQSIPNETTPTVTISPLNGTIAPYKQQLINVTVYISGSDKPGLHWSGFIQVIQQTNQTNPGGAVIQSGVAKMISINSTQPVGIPLEYLVIGVIAIAVAGAAIYYQRSKAKAPRASPTIARASASRSKAASVKGKGKKTAVKRKTRKAARKTSGNARRKKNAKSTTRSRRRR